VERLAPAKVNLFLHVGPPSPDGYHPLCSLVTFADVGDRVRLDWDLDRGFVVEGPFAAELGASPDNLVVKARDIALSAQSMAARPFRLTLDKRLPIAAGLGGGSADAAATIQLLMEAFAIGEADRAAVFRAAGALGADVPMCLAARPALAEGRGERLQPPPPFPSLDAVLVNPLVASPTAAVYRAFDAAGAPGRDDRPAAPLIRSAREMAAFLAAQRNDLEPPAMAMQPAISAALSALREQPETLLARMSGSGATSFAICDDAAAAAALASAVAAAHPLWWVQRCVLEGAPG
jgi:4-diphosphocytidyl-2-C-methyl-D-erythritol kinase